MDWHAFAKRLLLGHSGRVTAAAAEVARAAVLADGKVSADEFKFLLDIRREARIVGPEYAQLVYDLLEHALLRDRKIDASEVDWLRMVFLSGHPPTSEDLKFLRRLEEDAAQVCDEFRAMMREFEGSRRTDVFRP